MNRVRTLATALTGNLHRVARGSGAVTAQFCESCSQVCTDACRADARRDRARTTALTGGFRL